MATQQTRLTRPDQALQSDSAITSPWSTEHQHLAESDACSSPGRTVLRRHVGGYQLLISVVAVAVLTCSGKQWRSYILERWLGGDGMGGGVRRSHDRC